MQGGSNSPIEKSVKSHISHERNQLFEIFFYMNVIE